MSTENSATESLESGDPSPSTPTSKTMSELGNLLNMIATEAGAISALLRKLSEDACSEPDPVAIDYQIRAIETLALKTGWMADKAAEIVDGPIAFGGADKWFGVPEINPIKS